MKALALPFAALLCLALSGCAPTSIHPLYTSEDAVVVPALEGTWVDADKPDDTPIILKKSGDHAYTMTIGDPDTKSVQNYDVNLVRLGTELYMDIKFSDQTMNGEKVELPLGAFPTHEIVKIRINGDDLAYAVLDSKEIRKQNQWTSQPLAFTDTDDDALIVSSTADLRQYIATHADDIFGDFEHFTRKPPQP